MKIVFLILLFQNPNADSVKIESNFRKYQMFQYRNYDSALSYIDIAIGHAKSGDREKRYGELLREKGVFLKDNGKFAESLIALNDALQTFEDINDQFLQASTYNAIGVTYWRSGDNEKALTNYLRSRDMNLKLDNRPGLVRNYIALGNYFAIDHQYDKAIANYSDAERFSGPEDKPMRALVLKNTGNIYNDKRFSGFDTEKAVEYYRRSLDAYGDLKDTVNIAGLYVNLGLIYENKDDLANAERHYRQAIEMQKRFGLKSDLANSYLNLGNALLKRDQVGQAKQSYLEGFKIATAISNSHAYRNLARKLSTCFEKEAAFSQAYRYFQLYDSVDQVIFNNQTSVSIKELETKYETEKKQAEINLRTQQRDSIMITLMAVLVLTCIIVLILSQRQKMVAQLRERDKTLMDKKVDELLRDQEIKSLSAYLNGQDEERRRIAEDLHDRLGSTLSATKLYFTSIRPTTPAQNPSMAKATELLDTAVQEVREISHNLVSGSIAKFGLKTALLELKDTVANANQVSVELVTHGLDERLDVKSELHLYRIVQELVSNILKHAQASEITVQLNRQPQELTLTVEDNGKGFDAPSVSVAGKGLGLKNVDSRVRSLDGTMRIDSSLGRGTTVLIKIPYSHD